MMTHEQATGMVKAAPPVTVSGLTVLGYQLNEIILVLTAIYTLLQIVLIVRRLIVARRATDPDPACADCPAAKRCK